MTPVTFPPGRARLATSPSFTGYALPAITIGIVDVAALAARAAGVVMVTITSAFARISSAASAGSRSGWPSAHRVSIAMLADVAPGPSVDGLLDGDFDLGHQGLLVRVRGSRIVGLNEHDRGSASAPVRQEPGENARG